MAKLTDVRVATLKGFFNAGDQPLESQFADLIQYIQEGIEEHDHDGTGDGDGLATLGITGITGAGVDVPDGWYLGIGAALERIVFDAAGNIAVIGANVGIGTPLPLQNVGSAAGDYGGAPWSGLHVKGAGYAAVIIEGAAGYPRLHFADCNADAGGRNFAFDYDNYSLDFKALADDLGITRTVMSVLHEGKVGIRQDTPTGILHAKVVDAEALPVLVLEQLDISEGTINFIASDRGVIGEGTNSVESIRVEVNGVVRRIAVYADA